MPDTTELNGEHASAGPAFRAHPTHWIAPDETRLRAQSLFEGIPLFSEVPRHHLRELARFARSESFSPGEAIVRMGEPGTSLYVIRSGRVNVVREQASGNSVVLATFGPGEFFGELSIFDGQRRSASVIAVEPTETVALGRYDVVRVVTHNPQIGLSLLKSLSTRLRATDDRVVDGAPNAPGS